MKVRMVLLSVLVLAALLAPLQAQGPMQDKIIVTLPYPVKIGDTMLQPGEYTITQMSGPTDNRVLLVLTNGGARHETTVMTIPTQANQTPEDTKVILHHLGNDYYFDKIWIQGKNFGYEFVLPDAVKSRQKEMAEPVSVAARYEAQPAQEAKTEAKAEEKTETPQPAAQPKQEQQQTAEAQQQAERERQAEAERQRAAQEQTRVPPPAQEPPVAQELSPAQPSEPAERAEEIPDTASNLFTMLLAGGVLSGLGMLLRRRS